MEVFPLAGWDKPGSWLFYFWSNNGHIKRWCGHWELNLDHSVSHLVIIRGWNKEPPFIVYFPFLFGIVDPNLAIIETIRHGWKDLSEDSNWQEIPHFTSIHVISLSLSIYIYIYIITYIYIFGWLELTFPSPGQSNQPGLWRWRSRQAAALEAAKDGRCARSIAQLGDSPGPRTVEFPQAVGIHVL